MKQFFAALLFVPGIVLGADARVRAQEEIESVMNQIDEIEGRIKEAKCLPSVWRFKNLCNAQFSQHVT